MIFAAWFQVTLYATLLIPLSAGPWSSDWVRNDVQPVKRNGLSSNVKFNRDDFFVDGKHIPGVDFTVSDSYAGLLPISNMPNASKLFFWYWPAQNDVGKDDLVFYNSGGPGCSGIKSALSTMGPFILPYDTKSPVLNKYSWTQLSNIVFVDYPVGTGMSIGKPTAMNETDVAAEWYGLVTSFFSLFPELKGKKFWLSGLGYAGITMPYLVEYIAKQKELGNDIGINYQGFLMFSPAIVDDIVGVDIACVDYALEHRKTMGLNATFLNDLSHRAKKYGAYGFMKEHLRYFPEGGKIAIPPAMYASDYSLWDSVDDATRDTNACASIYDIRQQCPVPFDPLGAVIGGTEASAENFANNITGFREYIHTDPTVAWWKCASIDYLFQNAGGYDNFDWPSDTDLLQRVLEYGAAKRNVICHGEFDFTLIADGTAIALQNTTWFNVQGFQEPLQPFYVDGNYSGTMQNERGLLFARIAQAGHEPARKTPEVAYKLQQYMLGQVTEQELLQR